MGTKQISKGKAERARVQPRMQPPAKAEVKIETKRAVAVAGDSQAAVTPEERQRMIERAAYLRAERRGFQGGSALEDWLAAEAEIDRQLGAAKPAGEPLND